MVVGEFCDRLDVQDIPSGIADRFSVHQLGSIGYGLFDVLQPGGVHEGGVDSHAPKRDVELGDGAAIQVAGCHDLIAFLTEREHRHQLGSLSRSRGQSPQTAFERGYPLLKGGGGGVADPCVDVPVVLESKQVGSRLSVLEDEGTGGVDGHGPGPGLGVGSLSGVYGAGGKTRQVFRKGHGPEFRDFRPPPDPRLGRFIGYWSLWLLLTGILRGRDEAATGMLRIRTPFS